MSESTYRVAVFGATSLIATEILRAITAERRGNFLLIGRNQAKLESLAADLGTRGAECEILALDLLDPATDWVKLLRDGPWDLFLLAHGSLPDQDKTLTCGNDLARQIDINFTSHAVIAAACAEILERQGCGTLAAIGSVAGDRGRQSNYLYGSAKSAIATFMAGLRHRFTSNDRIHIVLLKPGMTDTPMTAGIDQGPLFSSAEKVGQLGWKAILKAKPIAYLPAWWSVIMFLIRSAPAFLFHRTKL